VRMVDRTGSTGNRRQDTALLAAIELARDMGRSGNGIKPVFEPNQPAVSISRSVIGRFGSNTALGRCRLNVRITPESGRLADMPDRQVRANRTQAPQQPTSPTDHLVRASERVGRISRPSRPAAVRLIMRSNLVGCSTGMSAGFAPRRIGGRATNCQIALGYLCG